MILLDLQMPGSVGFSGLVELPQSGARGPDHRRLRGDGAGNHSRLHHLWGGRVYPEIVLPARWARRMRQVLNGEVFLPRELVEAATGDAAPAAKLHDRVAALTQGELRVFELLAKGKSNKIIAYELGIKESTVKAHITAILRKLHVFSRTQAVIAARELDES